MHVCNGTRGKGDMASIPKEFKSAQKSAAGQLNSKSTAFAQVEHQDISMTCDLMSHTIERFLRITGTELTP
jgi:hypothetical protein